MMTDPKKLQYARMYIENLANGINPFDGTPVPGGDLVNDVRLSRCFFYVADLLAQIEKINGRQSRTEKREGPPFYLTAEQKASVQITDVPATVSELTRRMNKAAEKNSCRRLNYAAVLRWLINNGFLDALTYTENGRSVTEKVPTEKGKTLGILQESRITERGSYTVLLYGRNAQEFILNNIESMLSASGENGIDSAGKESPAEIPENSLRQYENQGLPWSMYEDGELTDFFHRGMPVAEISRRMGRTEGGIKARLVRLGLIDQRSDMA